MHALYIACTIGLLTSIQTIPTHAQEVFKCLVNGKTIYSDEPCSGNAVRKPIQLNHAAGIVSPDRDTVTDTLNRMRDENWANAVPGRSITRTTTRKGNTSINTFDNPLPTQAAMPYNDKKDRCQAFSARVEELDAMGRQPQSGSTMEWIRQERQKARDGQFRAGCSFQITPS